MYSDIFSLTKGFVNILYLFPCHLERLQRSSDLWKFPNKPKSQSDAWNHYRMAFNGIFSGNSVIHSSPHRGIPICIIYQITILSNLIGWIILFTSLWVTISKVYRLVYMLHNGLKQRRLFVTVWKLQAVRNENKNNISISCSDRTGTDLNMLNWSTSNYSKHFQRSL